MALVFNDVDIIDNYVVSNIIFNNSDSNDEVRDCTLAPSTVSSRSVLSFSSNKSEKLYSVWMQRVCDKMIQDEPVASSDSFQLKYTTPVRQNQNVSKVANTFSNTRNKHVHNVASTCVNTTVVNSNEVINIQLNYDINWALDQDS